MFFLMERKKLFLKKANRPTKSFFDEGDIVLICVEKSNKHYYDLRGGIVLNSSSKRRKQEALEMRVLQVATRTNSEFYFNNIPKLPFVQKYIYITLLYAEKFANLANLNEQISRLGQFFT